MAVTGGDPDPFLDRGPTGDLHQGPDQGPVQGAIPEALQEGVGGPDVEVDIGRGQHHLIVMVELRPTMLILKKLVCFRSQAL